MNVILSIHPKWAKLIYEGKKTIEWRKTTPKRANGFTKIFLYETAPVCKVTGYVRFNGPVSYDFCGCPLAPSARLVYNGCVSGDELVKYQGKSEYVVAWQIYAPNKLDTPKTLYDFGIKRPPQSWCYTEVDV